MCTASSSWRRNASLQVMADADERRADRVEHLRLRALDDRDEREHVLLLAIGASGDSQWTTVGSR